jgi:hypothetical protein
LGLHQDHHAEYVLSPEQQDLRRRVFHCVYSLDRYRLLMSPTRLAATEALID